MSASTEMGIPSAEALRYADTLRARQHESERWEPSRLIVCNWWMFTYQEFLLVDGHLVLNGLNGSGKSSVAATAVPVALDMLKHRRRFDPFGADERDPKDYLIGKWEASENSDEWHDDRTGYVIWEFRHRRTGDRVTCGVGFRARRSLGKDGEVARYVRGMATEAEPLRVLFDPLAALRTCSGDHSSISSRSAVTTGPSATARTMIAEGIEFLRCRLRVNSAVTPALNSPVCD